MLLLRLSSVSDDVPSETEEAKLTTVPTGKSAADGEQRDHDDGADLAHERTPRKNDRPYGYAIAVVGGVAAFISFVLVVVLVFQTRAVRSQLELSREALEISNESFRETLAAMEQQRDAMTAQVESVTTLTSTLQEILRDQQRARMSFRVELEEIDDVQTGIRIVFPIEIGGTTEARHVHFKNYVAASAPGQRQFLDSVALDWRQRESDLLADIAPTETGRRFVSHVLSQARMRTVVAREESLYFVGRLEYCDIYGACRYFMRCAEFGHQPGVIAYCGTRIGNLQGDHGG